MMDFTPLPLSTAVLLDRSEAPCAAVVRGWCDGGLRLEAGATHFGFVLSDTAMIVASGVDPVFLRAGSYFVIPGEVSVAGHGGTGMIVSRPGYLGLRQFGGPLESEGRLRYIDGCSDTLLVCPPRRGEPCLNHLHIPPATSQTEHSHPSDRIGVVYAGSGECRTPGGTFALEAGMGWYLPAELRHSFHTTDRSLDIVAWHPDSEFGPTDEDHPMINRTVR